MLSQAAYEEDLDAVFDVAAVRAALEARLRSLESELHQARSPKRTLGSPKRTLEHEISASGHPPGAGGAPAVDQGRAAQGVLILGLGQKQISARGVQRSAACMVGLGTLG